MEHTQKIEITFENFDSTNLNNWEDALPYDFTIQDCIREDQSTCPVSVLEIQNYIKLEFSLARKVKLNFIRTAYMNGVVIWIWDFTTKGSYCYATVMRDPDGEVYYGADDSYDLTPEQFLVCDYYINHDFPCPSKTWEKFKKERDAKQVNKEPFVEELKPSQIVLLRPRPNTSEMKTTFSTLELENTESLTAGALWNFTVSNITRSFRWAPPGEFMMGRPPEEPYPGDDLDLYWLKAYMDETYHPVVLTKGLF